MPRMHRLAALPRDGPDARKRCGPARHRPQGEPFVPAGMAAGAAIEDADLVQGGVHVGDVVGVDAVVGAERTPYRIEPPVFARPRALLRHGHAGVPQGLGAGAMLEPALQGAAQARAFVFDRARELVVAARHRVEHVGRHHGRLVPAGSPQQVLDHARERKARAGIGRALVLDGQCDGGEERGGRGDRDIGPERPVAEVDRIGPGDPHEDRRCAGLLRRSGLALGGHGHPPSNGDSPSLP